MTAAAFSPGDIDALTIGELRATGADKWTRYPEAIGAFIAEMDFGCSPVIQEAVQTAVSSGRLGYLSQAHVDMLASSTSSYLDRTFSWAPAPERIRPLADIVQGFQVFLEHFVPKGTPIIVLTPAYMPFLALPEALGIQVIQVPMIRGDDAWELDLPAIRRAFEAGARALIFCHPHNPIGKIYSLEELQQIAELVDEHDGILFSDEIHAPLLLSTESRHIPYATVSATAAQHSITAFSASKAFNIPGTKCCQLIFTGDEHFARWQRCGRWYEHQTSTLGVHATVAAYDHGLPWFEGVLDYIRANITKALAMLAELSPSSHTVPPEATYLLWVDIRQTPFWRSLDDRSLGDALREHSGVAITDGVECGEAGVGHIRVNTALPRPILIEALERLCRTLEQPARV